MSLNNFNRLYLKLLSHKNVDLKNKNCEIKRIIWNYFMKKKK